MAIQIRRSHPADIPSIHSLIKAFALFQQTPEKVLITPEQMMNDRELFQCFVAETGEGEIIGFASFYFAYYSWTGKALYLDDLYVKDEYRGQKTGTALLNAVIDHAKKTGCKKLRWQVSGWNEKAIEFYKSMGAAIDDVEINCDLQLL